MNAKLWISGGKCRVLVLDDDGRVIDTCDYWNNVASGQCWVNGFYPEAQQTIARSNEDRRKLDAEWAVSVEGN